MKQQLPIFTKRLPNIRQVKPIHRSSATKRRHKHPSAVFQRTRIDPRSLSPHEVLSLQQSVGNRAVRNFLANRRQYRTAASTFKPAIQAKLTIGPAGDQYEQEADRVARRVVQGIERTAERSAGHALQRQSAGNPMTASPKLEAAVDRARSGGQPLSKMVRGKMEQAYGVDFNGVRVHDDKESDRLNRAVSARAFTTGRDIFFKKGAYDPGSFAGRSLLAHELTHVVQQTGAGARKTAGLQQTGTPEKTGQTSLKTHSSADIQCMRIRTKQGNIYNIERMSLEELYSLLESNEVLRQADYAEVINRIEQKVLQQIQGAGSTEGIIEEGAMTTPSRFLYGYGSMEQSELSSPRLDRPAAMPPRPSLPATTSTSPRIFEPVSGIPRISAGPRHLREDISLGSSPRQPTPSPRRPPQPTSQTSTAPQITGSAPPKPWVEARLPKPTQFTSPPTRPIPQTYTAPQITGPIPASAWVTGRPPQPTPSPRRPPQSKPQPQPPARPTSAPPQSPPLSAVTWPDQPSQYDKGYLKELLNADFAKRQYDDNQSLLTDSQTRVIAALSNSPEGKAYLKKKGWLNEDQVYNYATGGDFSNWETMSKIHRLQISTYQYNFGMENTPGYLKGLVVYKETEKIYARDESEWLKTMQTPTSLSAETKKALKEGTTESDVLIPTLAATDIVRRIFIVLQYGLKYRSGETAPFQEWQAPVAVALSHGGRVNIRIPMVKAGDNPDAFFEWLTGGKAFRKTAGMKARSAGTHSIKIGKGETGEFKELKGNPAAMHAKTHGVQQFGMDLPVGGLGQLDLNGDVILPDGRYGHLFVAYTPPTTKRDGGLLIGCESDAPGKTNPLGHQHTAKAISAEFSSTGGAKASRIGISHGGMMVDLAEISRVATDWMDQLRDLEDALIEGRFTSADLVGRRDPRLFHRWVPPKGY